MHKIQTARSWVNNNNASNNLPIRNLLLATRIEKDLTVKKLKPFTDFNQQKTKKKTTRTRTFYFERDRRLYYFY
jgi:hypothetical protein